MIDVQNVFHQMLENLVEVGHVKHGTPAFDVVSQVIEHGYGSLTLKQEAIYEAAVLPALVPIALRRDVLFD